MSSDYSNISQFLSHPLVLLLIGAAISGVLIPYFTNRAANYQKGLEIKTDLVRRINESVMRFVVPLYSLLNALNSTTTEELNANTTFEGAKGLGHLGLYSLEKHFQDELEDIKKTLNQDEVDENTKGILEQKQKEVSVQLEKITESIQKIKNIYVKVDNEYNEWQVSSAVIESQIRSYFPEFGVKTEGKLTWSAFSGTALSVWEFAYIFYRQFLDFGPRNNINSDNIMDDFGAQKGGIIAQIQNSSVSGLSEHLFRRFFRKFTPRPESIKPDAKTNDDSNP
jgi:hypothetical protein